MALAALGIAVSPNRFSLYSVNCSRHGVDCSDSATLSFPCFHHKWRMVIAYDGNKFAGWQYQESPQTIQCLIEKALIRITKLDRKQLCLVGASRTDAGVHAWGQVAHFITPYNYDCLESLHAALNGILPSEIRVREISPACPEFHARFSTISKLYHYRIYNDPVMNPFQSHYAYHSGYKLNPAVMREAASFLVGLHDFTSFANASHNDGFVNPVKEIFRFHVKEMDYVLQIEVEGTGFLYRQVRNMVALLIQIGREALPPGVVLEILAARNRRELAKLVMSAPPHGLCLMSVNYSDDILKVPPGCPAVSFGRSQTIDDDVQRHYELINLVKGAPVEISSIVGRRRKDFTKEFFVYLHTVVESYFDNPTEQNALAKIGNDCLAAVQAYDSASECIQAVEAAELKLQDIINSPSVDAACKKIDDLANNKQLDSTLMLMLTKAWSAAKESNMMKSEVKDILYHLYKTAVGNMQRLVPKEIRILKYLLTIEHTEEQLSALKDAFTPGAELEGKDVDCLYTYDVIDILMTIFSYLLIVDLPILFV